MLEPAQQADGLQVSNTSTFEKIQFMLIDSSGDESILISSLETENIDFAKNNPVMGNDGIIWTGFGHLVNRSRGN